MPHELPKAYDPAEIEQRWAEYWVRENLFHAETHGRGQERLLPSPCRRPTSPAACTWDTC